MQRTKGGNQNVLNANLDFEEACIPLQIPHLLDHTKAGRLVIKNNKRVSAFPFPTLKLPLKPSFHLTAANWKL